MELFKCRKCDAKYPKEYFHNCKTKPNGIHEVCKFCANEIGAMYRKRRKEEQRQVAHIKLTSSTKKDYCKMYEFLESIGYDLNSDKSIHEQFCLKYGLKPIKREKKSRNVYNPQDCQKKTPTNNRRGLNE